MNVLKLGVKGVVSLLRDRVDVDRVIMGSDGQELSIRRVLHDLAPFSWMKQSSNSNRKVVVIVDEDVTMIVAN
jgi:hypothetical protein